MWLKLARNRYWLAFCVMATAAMLLCDNKNVVLSRFFKPQTVPVAIAQMVSPEDRVIAGNTVTFPNSSRVTITRAPIDPATHQYKLALRFETTADVPFVMQLKTDSEPWIDCLKNVPQQFRETAVVNKDYKLVRPVGATSDVIYTAAWLSEARTVSEYDFKTGEWFAYGIRANVSVGGESELDDKAIMVTLTLPREFTPASPMTQALFGRRRAYALIVVDKYGDVHHAYEPTVDVPEDFAYRDMTKTFSGVFEGMTKDDIRTVRLVAAPWYKIIFREPATTRKKNATKAAAVVPPATTVTLPKRIVLASDPISILPATELVFT